MAEDYLIALDIGTTAIKVGLFEGDGTLVDMAVREQALLFPQPGQVEQSPQTAVDLLASCLHELTDGIDTTHIAAMSISNHRGTAMALASDGQPLSEFVVWMDKRGVPYVDWLNENIGLETYYRTAGHPIVSYTGVSKVLWFQRSAPDIFERAAVIGPPQTYFLKWLGCEELVCDVSTGTFLFPFNIEEQHWSTILAQQIGVPAEKLPKLVAATDIVGSLSRDAAERLGLPAGIPLVAGGGDGQCAGVGSSVIKAGRAMINIGTGAGVQVFLDRPLFDPSHTLNCAAHVVSGSWEMEGHTQASGAAFRWLRDELGGPELKIQEQSRLNAYDLLVAQAAVVQPGAEGLLFVPTFNGSSAPIVDLNARGSLVGLTLSHTRGHIIRALLEGISMELRWMLDAIVSMGTGIEEIILVGGGARNPAWNQIHANIFDQPIKTLQISEAAMVGAAMCAAVALGYYPDWRSAAEAFITVDGEIEPELRHREVYAALYSNYKDFFQLMSKSGFFNRFNNPS